MIITSHTGDRLNLAEHVHEMCKLNQQDFRSIENTAFLSRLGQSIALAAGPNAPHGLLIHLRDRMAPELWNYSAIYGRKHPNTGSSVRMDVLATVRQSPKPPDRRADPPRAAPSTLGLNVKAVRGDPDASCIWAERP